MLILTGKNLGERHREINFKVIEAMNKKLDLNEVTVGETSSDINKLFQIDLASRYNSFDYIFNTLKSGDSFYITRALKGKWLYDDEYSNVINPNYLHHNLFPYMSVKMKKKMLTAISLHLRNEDRVLCFYSYCVNSNLNKVALKFLTYAPEVFKLELIKSNDYLQPFNEIKCIKHFIGSSFELAAAYVEMHSGKYRPNVVHELRFLYLKYEEGYLDMLERYIRVHPCCPNSVQRFGKRISKAVLKWHKRRFWLNPVLYVNKLNKCMLVKYLTSVDVKYLATLLLPTTPSDFWSMDFYYSYKFIFDLIPASEIFQQLKDIFSRKYGGESFEMNIQFYNLKYYLLFSTEERELWALQHIRLETELFGSDNDYIWYKFVQFEKAFVEIKKYICKTPDNEIRSEIVNVLIDSAKTHEDLTKLFHYYYERHVNENDTHKIAFVDEVILKHDIYSFNEECWTIFDKLLYSLEIYSTHNVQSKFSDYVLRSMIYHILNNKEFSKGLQHFIEREHNFYMYKHIILALSEERRYLVVKYWLDFHAKQLTVLLEQLRNDRVQEEIDDQVCLIWTMIFCYERNKVDCPETVFYYMKSNMDKYHCHPAFRDKFEVMNDVDFVRLLKNDIELAIESISKVMCNAYRWSFKLNRFFGKLKVYFSHDVSKEYLQYFIDSLDWLKDVPVQYRNIKMAVVGIFQLGCEKSKVELLAKYAPTNRKINHYKLDNFLLQIQKAICRLLCKSRTPIQLSSILKYIKGDYVHFCLPIFNHYSSNLPLNRSVEFIRKTINSPVSIQKHGLRLAFSCFRSQDLVQVILKIWKKTKNVSLRFFLYKRLYMTMVDSRGDSQNELYDVLKVFTLELDHLDHKNVFDLLVSDDMPKEFRGVYMETGWRAVSKLSNKKANLLRKTSVIYHMKQNIYLMNREFLREHIIDEHIRNLVYERKLKSRYISVEVGDLIKAKWDLTVMYIISGENTQEIDQGIILTRNILFNCLKMWSDQDKDIETSHNFCGDFLKTIHEGSCSTVARYINTIPIYQCILDVLLNSLGKEELYLSTWKLKLSNHSRRVLNEHYEAHKGCTQYKYPCAVEIAESFAKGIGELVQENVSRKEFYSSFYAELANALNNVCETMERLMDCSGFKILVCGYLMQLKMKEAHVFAVILIPKDPPKYWEKRHDNVVNMIKQCNIEEVRINFHDRFYHPL